jgi:hypothetical protein
MKKPIAKVIRVNFKAIAKQRAVKEYNELLEEQSKWCREIRRLSDELVAANAHFKAVNDELIRRNPINP